MSPPAYKQRLEISTTEKVRISFFLLRWWKNEIKPPTAHISFQDGWKANIGTWFFSSKWITEYRASSFSLLGNPDVIGKSIVNRLRLPSLYWNFECGISSMLTRKSYSNVKTTKNYGNTFFSNSSFQRSWEIRRGNENVGFELLYNLKWAFPCYSWHTLLKRGISFHDILFEACFSNLQETNLLIVVREAAWIPICVDSKETLWVRWVNWAGEIEIERTELVLRHGLWVRLRASQHSSF